MASKKTSIKKKRTRRMFLLGFSSIAIIITLTFTIGKYWIEIFEKYKEMQELEIKLEELQEKEKNIPYIKENIKDKHCIFKFIII